MAKQLQYDYTNMLRSAVGRGGVSEAKFKKTLLRLKKKHRQIHAFLKDGEQGFLQDVFNTYEEREIIRYGSKIRRGFSQLLVIGIGGSDLGARALQEIFQDSKKGVEILFLGDTPDPTELKRVFSKVQWKKCAVMPISKSGNTVEPLSTFLLARDRLVKAVGKAKHQKHVFVLTEDKPSLFHDLAIEQEYELIEHPHTIGGRWTVLSRVALISAVASGIDIKGLRKGARDFALACQKSYRNPSLVYSALHLAGREQGLDQAVLMPYSSNLEKFGAWYRQLFGESLGKAKNNKKKRVYAGITPIVSVGPKDQHSQIQLYNEGPFDKLITFVKVLSSSQQIRLPKHWKGEKDLAYLNGKDTHRILNIELEATASALKKHHRANGAILLADLSPHSIGQLFIFFELACVYLAEGLDINAFDQPGVEEGKVSMYVLLGKKGYENERKALLKDLSTARKII